MSLTLAVAFVVHLFQLASDPFERDYAALEQSIRTSVQMHFLHVWSPALAVSRGRV